MTLPMEAAEQVRRRLLEISQDHLRRAIDSMRELCMMIAAYRRGDENEVIQRYQTIAKLGEEATEIKRAILREIADVGMILLSREDFIRLASEVNTITDYCVGASYRLVEVVNRRWKVNEGVMEDLEKLAEASLDCVLRLRDVLLSLSYGGARTLELAKNVEAAERVVDNIYRKTELRIISSNMKLPIILIVRDIATFLEEIADKSEDVNEIIRMLAISL